MGNFEVHQGSLLDNMEKPIKSVYHEGGVENGGPLQEKIDARNASIAGNQRMTRAESAPPGTSSDNGRESRAGSTMERQGSATSLASVGQSIMQRPLEGQKPPKGRVSDVIRARTSQWKPHK